MDWQTTIIVGLLSLSILSSGGLAFLISRSAIRLRFPLIILLISAVVWAFAYAMEILVSSLDGKMFWAQIKFIGMVVAPLSGFITIQSYLGRVHWANLKRVALLLTIPAVAIILTWTNRWHNWMWQEAQISSGGPPITIQFLDKGFFGWITLIYSYSLLLWGSLAFLWVAPGFQSIFKAQIIVILIALGLPWGANALYLAGLSPISQLDFCPILFSISAGLIVFGIAKYKLFDLDPSISLRFFEKVNNIETPAIVLDDRNRVLFYNSAAKRMGQGQDRNWLGMAAERVFPWITNLDLCGNNSQQEISINVDGLRRFYHCQILTNDLSVNRTPGRILLLQDVTGERIAGEAIALAQIKTEFLAKVSHELRSPLTAIIGLAEMLDYGVYGPLTNEQRQAVMLIFNTTQQMSRLVNDLLQQSKLERGTFRLDLSQVNITELMRRVYERCQPMAMQKNLNFRYEISPDMPSEICNDSLRLYQIFLNLVENAIKYTHHGRVAVYLHKVDENRFGFRVEDTGVGIPKDLQQLIFNPFQQVVGDVDRKDSGFGLGLSIVKQLVSLMSGEIRVSSEIGEGSCFEVILPLELDQEQPE